MYHAVKIFRKSGRTSFCCDFVEKFNLGRSWIFTSFLNNCPTLLPINWNIENNR